VKKGLNVCPCGSRRFYADCCGQLHGGGKNAASAEALMRSRYSAYVLGLEPYLLATWHASSRPATLDLEESSGTKWLGLTVKRHQLQEDRHAIVEFVACYRIAGRGHRLHETSRFVCEDGLWYYIDGEIEAAGVA
jgi:SEC-C motif domain protein